MKYVQWYHGRLSRSQFFVGTCFLGIVNGAFGIATHTAQQDFFSDLIRILLAIFVYYVIFSLWIKRFHDLNKSGWWSMIALVPFINIFAFVILVFKKGNDQSNKYGDNPGHMYF